MDQALTLNLLDRGRSQVGAGGNCYLPIHSEIVHSYLCIFFKRERTRAHASPGVGV